MIKANEVRVGNILNTLEGLVIVSEVSATGGIDTQPFPHSREMRQKISPISEVQLTYEILTGLGFGKQMPGYSIYSKSFVTIKQIGPDFFPMHVHEKVGTGIRYLHKLQNLYFALTGEELAVDYFFK